MKQGKGSEGSPLLYDNDPLKINDYNETVVNK